MLLIFSCSSENDDNVENQNCINDWEPISSDINISRISVSSSSNQILREYVIENNRITRSRGGVVSLYDNCWFNYSYNSCDQLISVKCENGGLLRRKMSYDDNGRLKKVRVGYQGGYTLEFEYTQNNTVIIKEFRSYNESNDTHSFLNSTREWIFDSNDNMITSIIQNSELNYEFSNQNFITSTNYENIVNYHTEKNPFYLIFTNTYGRKNNFLINYGFDTLIYSNLTYLLEEGGLAFNLISDYTSITSEINPVYATQILETSNGYATLYQEINNGQISRIIEVEHN